MPNATQYAKQKDDPEFKARINADRKKFYANNREKVLAEHRQYYADNRDKIKKQAAEWYRDNNGAERHRIKQEKFFTELKNKPCMDCKNSYPRECMDFDHRPGEKKLGEVKNFPMGSKRMMAEIAKCDLICANCHRIRTRLRRELNRNQKQ